MNVALFFFGKDFYHTGMFLLYILGGYLLYGLLCLFLEHAQGSSEGFSFGGLLIKPLSANELSPAYWGNVPWSTAGIGFAKLLLKVGLATLLIYGVVRYVAAFFESFS